MLLRKIINKLQISSLMNVMLHSIIRKLYAFFSPHCLAMHFSNLQLKLSKASLSFLTCLLQLNSVVHVSNDYNSLSTFSTVNPVLLVHWLWRDSEHDTLKHTGLANGLVWAEGTWEIAGFWLPSFILKAGHKISREEGAFPVSGRKWKHSYHQR